MHTLVGICGCCGEPNVILKTDDMELINQKKATIEHVISEFEEKFNMKQLYEAFNIEGHSQLFSVMMEVEESEEDDIATRVAKATLPMIELVLKDAPQYYGLNLHIL